MSANNLELRTRLEAVLLSIKQLKEDFPVELEVLVVTTVNTPEGEFLDETLLNTYQDSETLFKIANAVGDMAEDIVEQEVYSSMVETNYGIIVLCGNNQNLTQHQPHIREDKLYKVSGMTNIKGVSHYQLEGLCIIHTTTNRQIDASYEASRFIIQTSYTSLN